LVVSRKKKSGDEPLLCKDLIRAVVAEADAMAQRGEGRFHFKITTNGLLLDDAFLEFAVENDARVDRRSGRRDPLPGGGRPVSQVTLQPYEVAGRGEGKRKRQGKKRRGLPFRIVGSGHGFLPFPFSQSFSFSLPRFALHSAEYLLLNKHYNPVYPLVSLMEDGVRRGDGNRGD